MKGASKMENAKWVYIQSEPGLYTVGFYAPNEEWYTDSDHGNREEAAKRVNYLNGDDEKTTALKLEVEHWRAIAESCECNDD